MTSPRTISLERILRSRWGRPMALIAVVLVVALATTVPRAEFAELGGRSISRGQIFLNEVVSWGAWALVAWPIGAFARWILAKSGSWLLLLLLQLPIGGFVAYGYIHIDEALRSSVLDRTGADAPRGADGRSRRAREGGERNPRERFGRRGGGRQFSEGIDLENPFWLFRWMQAVLVYWVVLVAGGGVHSFLEMRDKERQAAELELRAERLRAQLARAQMDTLQSQLNPHFLFNALHTVGGLVRAGESQTALTTLAAIGALLRTTLEIGDAEEVPLQEELQITERYLDIEHIRLGERLCVEMEIAEGLETARVPSLLLLPLVENSVRHGISSLPEGGKVVIRVRRQGSSIEIDVLDNGVGFPPEVLEVGETPKNGAEHRSIGLHNTRSRLRALYGSDQRFELKNRESGGAVVSVSLPYHEETLAGGDA